MNSEFENKRYTTLIKMREVFNVITGERTTYPKEYFVYDNDKKLDITIPNFRPMCYEDIRKKAIELNSI